MSRKFAGLLTLALAGVLLATCLAFVFAQRRRIATSQTRRAVAGSSRTINVTAGGNLQAAIDAAQPGDEIVLEAGASFVGPFTLPDKGATSEWITIRSSAPDSALPSPGQRITPAYSALLPKLLSPGSTEPALRTAPAANHYRFIALEFRTTNASAVTSDLIKLGDGSSAQRTLSSLPHHLTFDRCLMTAFATQALKRGIALNSGETEILGCWIAGFKAIGQDSQGIGGWNGSGPYRIVNNYIEAAGENVMIGGATVWIPNLVPSDIEVRRNLMTKPLSWKAGEAEYAGVAWTVKNVFELKNARRVVVEGNVFEHNWVESQSGFAIVLTLRADNAWATLEEVDFQNNIVRGTASAFNILGHDTLQASAIGHGMRIRNNLVEDVGGARWGGGGGNGIFMKVSEMAGLVVEHNTVLQTGNITTVYGPVSAGFEMRNNIMRHNEYGIIGDGKAPGMSTVNAFFPGGIIERNLIAGADAARNPPGNFYPASLDEVGFVDRARGNYRLKATSRHARAGTDGKNLGCDFDALEAAMRPAN